MSKGYAQSVRAGGRHWARMIAALVKPEAECQKSWRTVWFAKHACYMTVAYQLSSSLAKLVGHGPSASKRGACSKDRGAPSKCE